MLFNSWEFFVFIVIVYFVYWYLLRSVNSQNLFLGIVSYIFYGAWDARFLVLILASTLLDYFCSLKIQESNGRARKVYLLISVVSSFSLLFVFKYFNFFADGFIKLLVFLGFEAHPLSISIILPIGISFYTFQSMAYIIDVYKRRVTATSDFVMFGAYVSFFPQLLAGPIERAKNLLPQFGRRRINSDENLDLGLRLILWGLFKKIVIADNCADYANEIFDSYQDQKPLTLILGAVYFSFQIYGDFSGYSDMARGIAKTLGFDLMRNFNFPYFSKSIPEFWRRWHISLSTWFRDYLYIPLGGSEEGRLNHVRNILITFVVSGLWHGANWTFLVWGGLNGILFLPYILKKGAPVAVKQWSSMIVGWLQVLFTFSLVSILWIVFRSPSIASAWEYIILMFSELPLSYGGYGKYLPLIFLFVIFEGVAGKEEYPFGKLSPLVYYSLFLFLMVSFRALEVHEFIYFQF